MELSKRRRVRVLCYTEVFLDELDEGHVFQLSPQDSEVNPNINPNALLRVSMSTKGLSPDKQSDNIEAEATVISTRHNDRVRIENIQNLTEKTK